MLEPAAATQGTHGKADIWRAIANGEAHLLPMRDAAVVMEDLHYPKMRSLSGWLAGGDLETIRDAIPQIEAWSRRRGAQRVQVDGRKGWERVFAPLGWRVLSVRLAKDL